MKGLVIAWIFNELSVFFRLEQEIKDSVNHVAQSLLVGVVSLPSAQAFSGIEKEKQNETGHQLNSYSMKSYSRFPSVYNFECV